jgi:putative DNA primase/helicase
MITPLPEFPHSIEAEMAVLGAMLLGDCSAVERAIELVKRDDFYRFAHCLIFDAMVSLSSTGKPIDIITLQNEMNHLGTLEEVGLEYLLQLSDIEFTTSNIAYYAQIVKENADRRRIMEQANALWDAAQNKESDITKLLDTATKNLESLIPATDKTDITPIFDAIPSSLSPELRPVPSLAREMLPGSLARWLFDIAERGSLPVEYPASAAITALSSLVGRQVGIRPKQYDDWTVVPNLWGAVIGPPGVKKSPAVAEALKPLRRLEADAADQYESDKQAFEALQEIRQAQSEARRAELKKKAKAGASMQELLEIAGESSGEDEKPVCHRYWVSDTTVEMLGVLLSENGNGLLQFRDELTGFLKTLGRQGHESDRAFYLEAWNGTNSFTYDRIGRGTVRIEAACVSLFGTIQPGPLARYLRGAASGEEADGFVPRFQVMVYPDPPRRFTLVDRWPDTQAKNEAYAVFQRLAAIDVQQIGAQVPEDGGIPFLRFDPDAQQFFNDWLTSLENQLREDVETPLMQMHLAKFPSLFASLALLFHLAEGAVGPVSGKAAVLACDWCQFLEQHARRVYQSALDGDAETAQRLAERIKQTLPNPFTPRDVYRKCWAGLDTPELVEKAISILESRNWLKAIEAPSGERGGRPSIKVWINPALVEGRFTELSFDVE